ncbi:MAG: ribonuclease HI family protein [bacterium]|nr:ribonuclease HI family protein [bacterium]
MPNEITNKIITYTDGGSRGNPGEAAIGVYIQDAEGNLIKEYGDRLGIKTNNEAEYAAVISALKKIKALYGKEKTKKMEVEMRLDSELVVRQLSGQYKVETEHIVPLFMAVWNLKLDFARVSFNHVPREKNKDADRLVNEALDNEPARLF